MSKPITYVGIDAHEAELEVALLAPDATAPVMWTVRNKAKRRSGCAGSWKRPVEFNGHHARELPSVSATKMRAFVRRPPGLTLYRL